MTQTEALRLALEALESVLDDSPKVLDASISGGLYEVVQCRDAITAIKAALEAKDEPSMKVEGPLHVICQCDKCKPQIAFNAEVVGYVAPQRTWVGLTDEELTEAMKYWSDDSNSSYGGAYAAEGEYFDVEESWRYIEAKLRSKNNG